MEARIAVSACFPSCAEGAERREREREREWRDLGIIDLVIVPCVAFDSACGRLGHGKGYYDCFLSRLRASNAALSGPVPALVGLALDEQLVEAIPSEAHDQRLDFVVTPTTTYSLRS